MRNRVFSARYQSSDFVTVVVCSGSSWMTKPVIGFISGRSGTHQAKVDALLAVGAQVADTTAEAAPMVQRLLG